MIVIDLSDKPDLTTVELAGLLLYRRRLLRQQRDLRIAGLRGRARTRYEICGLQEALPEQVGAISRGNEHRLM